MLSNYLRRHATTPFLLRQLKAASFTSSATLSAPSTMRNIGISAHIDSGKTTLTERILFYTGRIGAIHDVKGKDGVGAKMDSMDLEREKGITIQSAATFCEWSNHNINIIDTPGHVDFTIEVERALRVLDGGVLVLCGVSGVQSQSLTVDRQMKRYNVPRVAFINKLDRQGSNPEKVLGDLREQLNLNAALVQLPIGLEDKHAGVIDVVRNKAYIFEGEKGETINVTDVPADMQSDVDSTRLELVERLADVDDEIGELFLMEEEITTDTLIAGIRRATIKCNFVPVFLGSAFKNKGVQPLLDGVIDYLPAPEEKQNMALDLDNNEAPVEILPDSSKPLLALAFKLEETKFGQLTYMRIYQGTMKKGALVINVNNGKKVKIPRLVRMHSDDMEEINEAGAGEVVATFGVDCSSMDSFTDGTLNYAMSSMFVPQGVMSISVKPKNSADQMNFGKALAKFSKEDPTLRISIDPVSSETLLSGMGELHLEVYVERMLREYGVECVQGQPSVAYKESINKRVDFDYLHKKQSGGSGQYAKVIGYIEPIRADDEDYEELEDKSFDFINNCTGTNIPPEYYPSCANGAKDAMEKGGLIECEVDGLRVVLEDGQAHSVDSSDMAFRIATAAAVRDAMRKASPNVLEPIMKVEVLAPEEFQGAIVGGLNRRNGLIQSSDMDADGRSVVIIADMPLANMFGYSTDLRSITQGKGEFTMEYRGHEPVRADVQEELIKAHNDEKKAA